MQDNTPPPDEPTPEDQEQKDLDAAEKKAGEKLDEFEDEVEKQKKKGHENDQ